MTILSRKLFFNSIFRAILEAYLKFCISTWISIKKLDFSTVDTKEEQINVSMTFFFLTVILGFPPLTYFILHKFKDKLENEDFKGRFESLYLNVNTKVDKSILMITLFVFRRLVYAAAIVFLAGSTVAQIFVQFFCCLMMTLFFIIVKPMNEPFLNRMEIFNELCLLVCSYYLFMFTDFIPDVQTRFLAGWGFIGIAVFNIGVNWAMLFYKVYLVLKVIVRRKYYQWKFNKLKAAKAQAPTETSTTPTLATNQENPLESPSKSKRRKDDQKEGISGNDVQQSELKQKKGKEG